MTSGRLEAGEVLHHYPARRIVLDVDGDFGPVARRAVVFVIARLNDLVAA
jgi:hypothetical protein